MHITLGYDPHLGMSVGIPMAESANLTWESRAAYIERLRAAVAATPGVIEAGISTNSTPPRNGRNQRFEIQGKPALEQQTSLVNFVSPAYCSALRIPLLHGRLA